MITQSLNDRRLRNGPNDESLDESLEVLKKILCKAKSYHRKFWKILFETLPSLSKSNFSMQSAINFSKSSSHPFKKWSSDYL